MNDLPGCVLPDKLIGRHGWLCNAVERPIHSFFCHPLKHLLRYSHRDSIKWDGKDCAKLREQIANLIRCREAGYPRSAPFEHLWIVDDVDRCKLEYGLGEIISANPPYNHPIRYDVERRSDVKIGAWCITYWSTEPEYAFSPQNNDVVVNIKI